VAEPVTGQGPALHPGGPGRHPGRDGARRRRARRPGERRPGGRRAQRPGRERDGDQSGRGPMTTKAVRQRRFRPAWLLAIVLLGLLTVLLVVAGFASAQVGNDANAHDPVANDAVPESVLDGGPIVNGTHTPVTSLSLPARTIVLTFDDGPDPTWTP